MENSATVKCPACGHKTPYDPKTGQLICEKCKIDYYTAKRENKTMGKTTWEIEVSYRDWSGYTLDTDTLFVETDKDGFSYDGDQVTAFELAEMIAETAMNENGAESIKLKLLDTF